LTPLQAPIITHRLLIRAVGEVDLADLMEVNGDEQVTRYLPYATWRTLDDGVAWLARMQALVATNGALQLVMVHASERRAIGTVLLFKFDAGSARLELGYALGRAHWRQGYAKEALAAVCEHAFSAMGIRRIEAEVHPDNVASNALLRTLGFVQEGRLRQRWVAKGVAYDTHIYGCLAEEWGGCGAPGG